MSCAKTAELIDLLFGLWTWRGPRKHKFNRIRQVAPMPSWKGTLAPPGEYDWTARLLRGCSVMSNCFDHLLLLLLLFDLYNGCKMIVCVCGYSSSLICWYCNCHAVYCSQFSSLCVMWKWRWSHLTQECHAPRWYVPLHCCFVGLEHCHMWG